MSARARHSAPPARRPQSWRAVAAIVCGWLASACLSAMVLLTVADVILRALVNRPIRGVYEIVELLLAGTFFLALPATFLRDEHIVVDIADAVAPAQVARLQRLALVVAVVTLAVMGWQSWLVAADSLAFGDVTADLALPRVLYWVPVVIGIIVSAVFALVVAMRQGPEP